MEQIYETCEGCGKEIKYGNAYVTITRNIEQAEHKIVGEDYIEMIDSTVIIYLCGKCGNMFNTDKLYKIINSLSLKDTPLNSN